MNYHIIKLYERLSYMVMIKEINRFDMHRLVELSLMWEKVMDIGQIQKMT